MQEALQKEVAESYPGLHVATLMDLRSDDREFFIKDHWHDCPGLLALDFYGDPTPAFAIELLSSNRDTARLVVARRVRGGWSLKQFDSTKGPPPVVYVDHPGQYVDIESGKRIKSSRNVIVWCVYESWAIVFGSTDTTVQKVWIAD